MPRARAVVATLAFGLTLAASGTALAQGSPGPSPAPPSDPRDQIVLSGDVNVRRGEDAGEVVVLHGSATVAGVVHGDVVVVDGTIDVTGQVSGSVVSINGPVSIGPNAQILGDVLVRDRLRVAEGARIGGTIREGTAFTFRTPIDVVGPFAAWLAVAVSTLVLGALLLLFAPRGAEAVATAALTSPLASGGIGLAAFLGLPLLGVLALLSLVGLPLGIGLLLALVLLYSIGFAWSVFTVGRALWREPRSRWLALPIGWVLVAGVSAIPFVGGLVWFVGSVIGLGAMTVAAWRARGSGGGRHRPGGKMLAEPVLEIVETTEPEPMITERAMREEGTGI
ncbi:MAG: hypothetical protein ACXWX6_09905 [Actinomycetota bacterium]